MNMPPMQRVRRRDEEELIVMRLYGPECFLVGFESAKAR